jgi:4-hydroxybenzoate polyprenyltransferase
MKKVFIDYTRLVKFEHTIFALPFALIGFFLAIGQTKFAFSTELLAEVILCMIFARNSAMAFNRYLDRDIDGANPRTSQREIPAGIVSPKKALAFVIINSALFIITTWFINQLCFMLSPIALAVILGYSYTKRFTPLCHFILSSGLALAPIGAYLAVTGSFAITPLIFSLIVFFWVSGFDIIYSCQDADFDKEKGLKSIPVILGIKKALTVSTVTHIATIILVVIAGFLMDSNLVYWLGAVIFSALIIYQHTIVKANDLSRVNLAFGTTNGIASVLFATFVIASLYY